MTTPSSRGPPAQSGFKFGTPRRAVPPMLAAKKSRAAEAKDSRFDQQHHQNQSSDTRQQSDGVQYRDGGNRTNAQSNQGDYNREPLPQKHPQRTGIALTSQRYPPQRDSLHGSHQAYQPGDAQYRGGDRPSGAPNHGGYDREPARETQPHPREEGSALKRHPSEGSGIHGAGASSNQTFHYTQSDDAIVKFEVDQDNHRQSDHPTARVETRLVQHDPPLQQRPLNEPGVVKPRPSYPGKQSTSVIMDRHGLTDSRARGALVHQADISVRNLNTENFIDPAVYPTIRPAQHQPEQHRAYPRPREVTAEDSFPESQPEDQVEPARESSMFESSQVEADEDESQRQTPYPTQRSTSTFVASQPTLRGEYIESNTSGVPSQGVAGYPSTIRQVDRGSIADSHPPRGRTGYPSNNRQADQGSVPQLGDPAKIGVSAVHGKSNQGTSPLKTKKSSDTDVVLQMHRDEAHIHQPAYPIWNRRFHKSVQPPIQDAKVSLILATSKSKLNRRSKHDLKHESRLSHSYSISRHCMRRIRISKLLVIYKSTGRPAFRTLATRAISSMSRVLILRIVATRLDAPSTLR